MGYAWNGQGYDTDWYPLDDHGVRIGPKDWQANAEYAAQNGTQNPYTNEAGASPFDHTGLVPGNEAGSTLPRVSGGYASQTPEYANLAKSLNVPNLAKAGTADDSMLARIWQLLGLGGAAPTNQAPRRRTP